MQEAEGNLLLTGLSPTAVAAPGLERPAANLPPGPTRRPCRALATLAWCRRMTPRATRNASSHAHFHGVPVGLEYRGQGEAIVGEAYSSPYPTGNSGSALSSGTSESWARTAAIERGNSNGRLPPGCRCPAIVCMRTASETP